MPTNNPAAERSTLQGNDERADFSLTALYTFLFDFSASVLRLPAQMCCH